MSGFDENPFGEPTINDPFSDPSIRRAVSSTPANTGLEDYNPFAEQGSQGTAQVRGASNPPIYGGIGISQQPATLQPSSQEPPATNYARTQQQTVNTSIGSTSSPISNQMSEPELKSSSDKCCYQLPCFHETIHMDIRVDAQKVVRQLHRLWIFHGFVLILNVIGGFILLVCNEGFSTFGLGILYLILFIPFSFLCWYRPAYKAFQHDSSFNFMVFFFVFFFQLIVTSIQAIGIPGSGTCGIITAITMFRSTAKGIFVGLILLIIAMCFVATACGELLLLTQIHRIYGSMEVVSVSKAQKEFATTFLRNAHVQQVTKNFTTVGQMDNSANQSRY